jgi:hypothetical protein
MKTRKANMRHYCSGTGFQVLRALSFTLTSSLAQAQNLELPQLSGPLPTTPASHAFLASEHQQVPVDLKAYGYIEEEYLVSGEAGIYAWPQGMTLDALAHSPYVTRILVRRPADDAQFSGITIVEAFNPSPAHHVR